MLSTRAEGTRFGPAVPRSSSDMPLRSLAIPAPTADAVIAGPLLLKPMARARGGLAPRTLGRVREYIETHLDERISIESLAAVAGLSLFHFARAFKQSEGITPHDYLIKRRVKRVMELLAGTDLPLSEIAPAVGFSDQSHCARRFREHVGVCPRDYRWSMR